MLAQVSPTDIQKAADYASQQSDRWLFVALLIIGLIAVAIMVKYGMKLYEGLVTKLDAMHLYMRETYATKLNETTMVIAANTQQNKETKQAIDANTAALEGIREIISTK